jgi:cephalosporin-C deacetylase
MIEITPSILEKQAQTALVEHSLPFDPTYGYGIEQLLAVPAPDGPSDFAAFWEGTYAEARGVDLAVSRREVTSPDRAFRLFEVEYTSLGGVRIGAWVAIPAEGKITSGWVMGHGYGTLVAPELSLLPRSSAAIFFCARGLGRSENARIPNVTAEHVVHGIESRETYVWRGCVADVWGAASTLLELHPEVEGNLFYHGSSFGGGLGALALPWDARFTRAYLGVPTFGNHPLRLSLPCTGSGNALTERYAVDPAILDVLVYFDAATAARFIKVPVLVDLALFDPAVPPPGQFAVANAIPEKEIFIRVNAHSESKFDEEANPKVQGIKDRWFGTSAC